MKRKNPDTNDVFHRGDTRLDGYVFFAYTKRRRSDGHFIEIWLNPLASERATVNDRQRKRHKAHGDTVRHATTDA